MMVTDDLFLNSDEIIPSKDKRETFMRAVYLHAADSKDPRTKIGSVIVRDQNIISTGFNGFARKVKDLKTRYEDRSMKHKFIAHAEANAVFTAARLGQSTEGTTLYTQGVPCNNCMIAIIQAGINKVVVHKQWPNLIHSQQWVEAVELSLVMMQEAGIELEWLDKVLEVKGILDGREIFI